jgi:transcription termination/antitermination protein NusG
VQQFIPAWYVLTTRSRQEKIAAFMLGSLDIEHFLPLLNQSRKWSDRTQKVLMPLFPGYLFVRISRTAEYQLRVLKVPGIVDFVRNHAGPLAVPEQEIDDIRGLLASGVACVPHPFPKAGDQVRIVRGPLAGLVGTLVRGETQSKLVISVEMIKRSVAVSVLESDIVVVPNTADTHWRKRPPMAG